VSTCLASGQRQNENIFHFCNLHINLFSLRLEKKLIEKNNDELISKEGKGRGHHIANMKKETPNGNFTNKFDLRNYTNLKISIFT